MNDAINLPKGELPPPRMVKVSRIVAGNPNEPDHWDDIMGYALLGKSGGHPVSD